MRKELRREARGECRQHRLAPDALAAVKQEGDVGKQAGLRRGLHPRGNQRAQIELCLMLLHHGQAVLDTVSAGFSSDRPEVLADDGHDHPVLLHPLGEGVEIGTGGTDRVDERHTLAGDGHLLGEQTLGLGHTSLVLRDRLLEISPSRRVTGRRRHEALEELLLGVLADLRLRLVEGRESRERLDGRPPEGGQRLHRLLGANVEHLSVVLHSLVRDPTGLHGRDETVVVGISDDHLDVRELPELDQGRAAGSCLAIDDLGVVAQDLLNRHGGLGVAPFALVVVADRYVDTPLNQRLDGRGEVGGHARVHEQHASGADRDDFEDRGGLRRREEFRKNDGSAVDDDAEHCLLLPQNPEVRVRRIAQELSRRRNTDTKSFSDGLRIARRETSEIRRAMHHSPYFRNLFIDRSISC